MLNPHHQALTAHTSARWIHPRGGRDRLLGLLLSVGLHGVVLVLASGAVVQRLPREAPQEERIDVVLVAPLEAVAEAPPPPPPPAAQVALPPLPSPRAPEVLQAAPTASVVPAPAPAERTLARQEAPEAPSAQAWAFAAKYTLKNSKAYRYTWAQQVRSMMGTAFEGAMQGQVRFRVTISPEGRVVALDTLWTTSAEAEVRARAAVMAMTSLPPTPTGAPLVFEKTIGFSPFATDDTPIYKDDCQPDPPAFSNPFAWNGNGAPPAAAAAIRTEPLDPQAMAECLKQLPQDSIEAEAAHDQRQLEQWRSSRLGR